MEGLRGEERKILWQISPRTLRACNRQRQIPVLHSVCWEHTLFCARPRCASEREHFSFRNTDVDAVALAA